MTDIKTETLTQIRLKELLFYCTFTGVFIWKIAGKAIRKDNAAGGFDSDGYIRICIDKKLYAAHRLVFLYITGKFPPEEVDHINSVRNDNRWHNLRLATKSQNMGNRDKTKHNTSGFKGVSFDKRRKKYYARITYNGKNSHLGYYDSAENAHSAYRCAADRLNLEFGTFYRH